MRLGREAIEREQANREVFLWPLTSHELPYFSTSNVSGKSREEREVFQRAFQELGLLVSAEAQWSSDAKMVIGERSPYAQPLVRSFPNGVPAKLAEIYRAVQALVKEAQQAGYEQGNNLLAELAEGRITVMEYNDRQAKV